MLQNKHKIIFFLLFPAGIAIVFFISVSKANYGLFSSGENSLTYYDISKAIKAKYDQELDNFTPYKASHYAARIYRISGDTSYLDYNLRDLNNMRTNVEKLLKVARESGEVEYSKSKVEGWSSGTRSDLRRESLSIAPAFPYYWDSLMILRRGLEYSICGPRFDQLKEHVLAYDYTRDLSNPFMIRAWAAQLANIVVWIRQLGGADYRDVFIKALQQVYPDHQDHLLNTQQYENRLYGLTHIILAESQYYQYHIKRDEYAWIFDYFDRNIDSIISRAKADVVAEVGVAYLLAGEYDHPALEKIKQNIAQQYNETYRMIPSVNGNFKVSSGAHRNILAIMLLSAPEKFYPGPLLGQIADAASLPDDMHGCVPQKRDIQPKEQALKQH